MSNSDGYGRSIFVIEWPHSLQRWLINTSLYISWDALLWSKWNNISTIQGCGVKQLQYNFTVIHKLAFGLEKNRLVAEVRSQYQHNYLADDSVRWWSLRVWGSCFDKIITDRVLAFKRKRRTLEVGLLRWEWYHTENVAGTYNRVATSTSVPTYRPVWVLFAVLMCQRKWRCQSIFSVVGIGCFGVLSQLICARKY